MTCRQSRLSSAMVTFARDMTGLADNQILALNHALMQEGAEAPAYTPEQWNALVTNVQDQYRSGNLSITAGSRDPLARLEASRTETPDAARAYAVERLLARAQRASAAQENYITQFASSTGLPESGTRRAFNVAFTEATENAQLCATPEFIQSFTQNPDNAGLLVDRRSLYAYQQLEATRRDFAAAGDRRPAVTARETLHSTFIHDIGYDPINGRLEMTFARNPEQVYAYRMSPADYQAFRDSGSMGSYFATNIRNNPTYQYETAEAAEAARFHNRCRSCGQFAGVEHSCPPAGSNVAVARETAAAVAQATQTPAPVVRERVDALRTTRYLSEGDTLRIPGVNRITAGARSNIGGVNVPVNAVINDDENNAWAVRGDVTVSYLGRANGYNVAGIAEDDADSEVRQLRCNCPDYQRNYRCRHTTAAVDRVRSLLNGENATAPEAVVAAASVATEDLTRQYEASVAAEAGIRDRFVPSALSLAEDNEAFQEVYEAMREKRAAFLAGESTEHPVPYLRENAFGGLGTRESGRGFGIELEYAFPSDMSHREIQAANQRIGQELHALGLTPDARQRGYGASHGAYRDYHANGWSFESDPTTGGSDGNGGGEIVSPVMFDEPETWENIEKISDILKRNGAFASRGSGMHVHVGIGDYDHRVENHNKLLQAFAENEDLMYRLSTDPTRGRHRNGGYSRPNNMPANPYTTVNEVRNTQSGHHIGLNMQSVQGRSKDHVEFRTFDATLTPNTIQAHIGVAVYMAEGATRDGGSTTPNANRTPLGARLNANPSRGALTGEQWRESTLGIRKFIDRFVPDPDGQGKDNPRLQQLVGIFAMTKWQGTRNRAA